MLDTKATPIYPSTSIVGQNNDENTLALTALERYRFVKSLKAYTFSSSIARVFVVFAPINDSFMLAVIAELIFLTSRYSFKMILD